MLYCVGNNFLVDNEVLIFEPFLCGVEILIFHLAHAIASTSVEAPTLLTAEGLYNSSSIFYGKTRKKNYES